MSPSCSTTAAPASCSKTTALKPGATPSTAFSTIHERRRALGNHARAHTLSHHTWNRAAEAIERVLTDALHPTPNAA